MGDSYITETGVTSYMVTATWVTVTSQWQVWHHTWWQHGWQLHHSDRCDIIHGDSNMGDSYITVTGVTSYMVTATWVTVTSQWQVWHHTWSQQHGSQWHHSDRCDVIHGNSSMWQWHHSDGCDIIHGNSNSDITVTGVTSYMVTATWVTVTSQRQVWHHTWWQQHGRQLHHSDRCDIVHGNSNMGDC